MGARPCRCWREWKSRRASQERSRFPSCSMTKPVCKISYGLARTIIGSWIQEFVLMVFRALFHNETSNLVTCRMPKAILAIALNCKLLEPILKEIHKRRSSFYLLCGNKETFGVKKQKVEVIKDPYARQRICPQREKYKKGLNLFKQLICFKNWAKKIKQTVIPTKSPKFSPLWIIGVPSKTLNVGWRLEHAHALLKYFRKFPHSFLFLRYVIRNLLFLSSQLFCLYYSHCYRYIIVCFDPT